MSSKPKGGEHHMTEQEVKILTDLANLIKEMSDGAKDALLIYGQGLRDGSKLPNRNLPNPKSA